MAIKFLLGLRILRPIRLVLLFDSMKTVVNSILYSFIDILIVWILTIIILSIFGILLVYIFKG